MPLRKVLKWAQGIFCRSRLRRVYPGSATDSIGTIAERDLRLNRFRFYMFGKCLQERPYEARFPKGGTRFWMYGIEQSVSRNALVLDCKSKNKGGRTLLFVLNQPTGRSRVVRRRRSIFFKK